MNQIYDKQAEQTKLFNALNVVFAFNVEQFNKQANPELKYNSFGSGIYVPIKHTSALIEGLNNIQATYLQHLKASKTDEQIILDELFNYECFLIGDYSDALNVLFSYGFKEEEINKVYNKHLPIYCE